MKRLVAFAVLAVAAAALAADMQRGTTSTYSQPIGVRDPNDGKIYPVAGTDAGYQYIVPASSLTSAPAPTITTIVGNVTGCTAVGGASCSAIYPSTDWGAVPNLSIAITNNAASAVLSDVLVEWSPIADGGGFELWDSTMFDELGAGVTKSVAISGNSRRYLRIEARGAADGGPIHVSVTGNQN